MPPEEPDEPELPEDVLDWLPPEEPPLEEEEDELGEDAPPLLDEEDCWLTQPPTRNADTAPTIVPCAARTSTRRMAVFTLRSDV